LRPFLDREEVTEILVNRPGEVWVEAAGQAAMACHAVPELTDRHLGRLAQQVARISHQGINRQSPLLGAVLPDGARIQFVAPPATRRHWAMAIRRHRLPDLPLDSWRPDGPCSRRAHPAAGSRRRPHRLAEAGGGAAAHDPDRGGTSTGKTTFLNALLAAVPVQDRIIAVEDTPEIRLCAPNALGLVAVREAQGEAQVTTGDLLQASLRLRPDRIVLGEMRGSEAVTFLRAINTGHQGSFSTIHANSARGRSISWR
jgi:type IV secretion system protein VirB11